jgi:hypothetical protein
MNTIPGSRSRFANLVFRFDNKWCYRSEDITTIFLAAAAEKEEQEAAALCGARWIGSGFCEFGFANIRMEENNRYSCGGKKWFGRIKRGDHHCGRYLAPLYAFSYVGLAADAHFLDRHPRFIREHAIFIRFVSTQTAFTASPLASKKN